MKFLAQLFTKQTPQEHRPVYNNYFEADNYQVGNQVYHKQHGACTVVAVMARYSTRAQIAIKTKKGFTYNVSPVSLQQLF